MAEITISGTYFVRVTKLATGGGFFLMPSGGLNTLRVHASIFNKESADRVAAEINEEHKGVYSAKSVPTTGKQK